MKKVIFSIYFLFCVLIVHAQDKAHNRTRQFDAGWRFIKDSTILAKGNPGVVHLTATAKGLKDGVVQIKMK